jgi:hypothetical protein
MSAFMTRKSRWFWRKDLAGFRGLTKGERSGFLLVLEWFCGVHDCSSAVMENQDARPRPWQGLAVSLRDGVALFEFGGLNQLGFA